MADLTVFENETRLIGEGGLTTAEAEYLALLGEERPGFCTRGHRSIHFAQYCGLVNLGNRMLEILPKFAEHPDADRSRGMLLRLLTLSRDLPLFQHLPAGHHLRSGRLLEVFIAAFLESASRIVRGGLMRQYRPREEELHVVRGQIMLSRQFGALFNRPDIAACRFDDLTADNVWNQLIKAGLRAVGPWIVSVEVNRRWVELMTVFSEVNDIRFDRGIWSRLVWDRHAVRYRAAIDWVRWILALLTPGLRAGHEEAPGLLFDMNALFQSALTTALSRAAWGSGLSVHRKGKARSLAGVVGTQEQRAFTLKPDIVITRGDHVVAIADMKWKSLTVKDGRLLPAPQDVYQMNAYASAYRCSDLALIYPWHSNLSGSIETAFHLPTAPGSAPRLTIICVELEHGPLRMVRGSGDTVFSRLVAVQHLPSG